jgi:hypothetical protein
LQAVRVFAVDDVKLRGLFDAELSEHPDVAVRAVQLSETSSGDVSDPGRCHSRRVAGSAPVQRGRMPFCRAQRSDARGGAAGAGDPQRAV